MRIGSINNTTFEARIRMAKPDTTKLVKGTATALAGTASLYTGLNAIDSTQHIDVADNIYKSAENKHIVETPQGGVYVDNWKSAALVDSSFLSSLPTGPSLALYGSTSLKNSFSNTTTFDKKTPD